MSEEIRTRSPHDPAGYVSVPTLVESWSAAGLRTFLARNGQGTAPLDVEDYWTELALGTRIARDVTCSRWVTVADLLRAGGVDSWSQIGTALDVTETQARDGFHGWIAGQVHLRRTGSIGLTDTEAEELYELSEAITW